MVPRIHVAAVLLAVLVAGCAGQAPDAQESASETLAADRAIDWSPGNWWAYHAVIEGTELDVAIILHEVTPEGYRLGTNLTSGFFGLPWSGNVSAQRNPTIGAEEWKLFELPLHDGQEWSFAMLGHEAKTRARGAAIPLPDGRATPGFLLESTSYGQLFARYDYAEEVGWFTHLELIEPTDGHTVLEAKLTAFGSDWGSAYFVERVIREARVEYPSLPGTLPLQIPPGYETVRANLLVQSATGAIAATLRDDDGRALASATILARGVDSDRATARPGGAATWTLDHKGAALGAIHLEITGIALAGPLAEKADQSTRPAWPQAGQTISVPFPLGSGA